MIVAERLKSGKNFKYSPVGQGNRHKDDRNLYFSDQCIHEGLAIDGAILTKAARAFGEAHEPLLKALP